jgi:hypothetical protein
MTEGTWFISLCCGRQLFSPLNDPFPPCCPECGWFCHVRAAPGEGGEQP